MGKIRIMSIGEEKEENIRDKQQRRREQKKKREKAIKVRAPGLKGGERVKTVDATSEEELERLATITRKAEEAEEVKKEEKWEKEKKKVKKRIRSNRYQQAVLQIDPKKQFSFSEAVALLRNISLARFDSSIELHINTIKKGLRGTAAFPHGTGKKVTITIADKDSIEKIIKAVEDGKIDFDILIAHPEVMSQLAKVARILGPRGLMPNPKTGTISDEPQKVVEKLQKGSVSWKTEAKFPIIHQVIGRLSFKDEQLKDNFDTLIKSIGEKNIKNIILKSTMSPGIKMAFSS